MNKSALLKRVMAYQHDQKDCGSACLLTAIRWYGYKDSLEHIRILTGTNAEGVNLLGLQQAGNQIGFKAEAFRASLGDLSDTDDLFILHTLKYGQLQHFVLCVGKENGKWLIADPEDGVKKYTDDQLMSEWQGVLLRLKFKEKLNLPKGKSDILSQWFLPLFTSHKKRLFLILTLGILHAVLLFSTSIFTERLVDELLPSKDKSIILSGVLLWAAFLVLALGLSYVRSHYTALFSRDFNADLIKRFFDKLLYLPKSFFDSKKTGDLVTRLEDVEDIEESATKWIEDGIIGFLVIIVAIGLLFVYDVQLALVNLILLPLLFVVILNRKSQVNTSQREAMVGHAMNNANYVDVITGMDVIKSRQAEVAFGKNTLALYRAFRNKVFRAEKVGISFGLVVQCLAVLITISVIGISCFKVLQGSLQMGNFLAIISISSIASANTTNMAYALIDFEQVKLSFERMYDLIGQSTEGFREEKPLLIKSDNELIIEGLGFSFPGHPQLVKDVSLKLKAGKLVTLLGASGSGKSTLINLIATLYFPDSGVIRFNGQDIHESLLNWRSLIGVVPQETKVFNATFWENVAVKSMGEDNRVARNRVEELISTHQLQSFTANLPLGMGTVLGENGVRLSGGQKRILGLLRALYHHPMVLLLDEVTSSLDRQGEALVAAILQKLKYEMPILQITHNPFIARDSDYIYLLQNGNTGVHGTPELLLKEDNFYGEFFSNPFYLDNRMGSVVEV
ncbi:peptidase domain-containing ABC transporter [Roseivirga sp. 4D4]|uniref:peptidase domain-containing ABC transporter n=1 Tax=Roseivirga sp. 4D4 TaxID=1889784 RepID=UPI00147EC4B4|nr:ABC transporter transmembrane domain-containing protein [Roseivirga sp. 4D4]